MHATTIISMQVYVLWYTQDELGHSKEGHLVTGYCV
jgi:hypothetical protein